MAGWSFSRFRPLATILLVPAPPPRNSFEIVPSISSIDLSEAQKIQSRPEIGAPIDLDKRRDRAASNTDGRRTLAEIESNATALCDPRLDLEAMLLSTSAKPLMGELPEPRTLGRDLRIDLCRGLALWCIFLNHIPNNVGSWLTLRNYGFSDTAEVFMFVSGVTCALSYGKARSCEGWTSVISRTLSRSWDIYAAFLLLTVACAIMAYLADSERVTDESNTRILFEHPGAALVHAAILQYRPVNTDVLPLFVLYHLLFTPLLWLLLRMPNVALGASLSLYALVHVFSWTVPAWPQGVWFFNPLAWQVLFVLGAWCATEADRMWPWLTSHEAVVFAVLYLAFGLIIALSWSIKSPLVPQTLAKLIYPMDKSNLDPLRLLHFVSLAIVIAWLVPRNWRALSTPLIRGAIRCGENSLAIFCLGVVLALASHIAIVDISDGLAMQIALSLAGVLVMIAAARLLGSIKIKPRQQAQLF